MTEGRRRSRSFAPAFEIWDICKAFGPTRALDTVTLSVARGTCHGILGENGAGKSTLVKLLSGLIQPDSGSIMINGTPVRLDSARDAQAYGIQTVFQETTLIPDLSVLDNMLMLKSDTGALGILRRAQTTRSLAKHFAELGLDLPLHRAVGDLDPAERQKIEIARALYCDPEILLLDEPTSALTGDDVAWFGNVMRRCKARKITALFISHRLPEVRSFCDQMSILRNGQHIQTERVGALSDMEITERIIGRSLESAFPEPAPRDTPPNVPVLETHGISVANRLHDLTLTLHQGEILGVAGLHDMGQKELFSALFGALPLQDGTLLVDGKAVHLRSPADALHPSVAIGFVPEDRKTEGLFLNLTGRQNATLPALGRLQSWGVLDPSKESAATAAAFDAVDIDARAHYLPVSAFSGGHQQKIAIAKWLVAQSRILLLFDPMRGIDPGTKQLLYGWMRDYAAAGGAILFHSTEIPELVHMSDRVGVLYEGRISAWLSGEDLSENNIMHAALGGASVLETAL